MKKMQQTIGIESRRDNPVLTHKPVHRDQALANGIDGEEKTFESDGAEQGWPFWRNKALSRDCIAIQSQPCFGYGPDLSLSPRDHDALRAGGFQLKPFRQRSWHHAKRSPVVHKKLNFFNTPRRTGQMSLYVEQSHIKSLLKNTTIVTQPINNATTLISLKKVARPLDPPFEQATKFGFIMDFVTANAPRPEGYQSAGESGQSGQVTHVRDQKSEVRNRNK
jgi:hypothetical protein